ncbi:hypothetical protein HCA55_17070 [Listeria booriae]|uniref:Uncharacterized protein n=1 Tax=Listeria booriae TaxID=1552123 RepID=A0A842A4V8_9LIST|nr:hypothetical protein [Listeria booriae]MBC1567212.1 hypothetical protein [Listeria booriae]MBC1798453.1 hypothetical protein [Listeria booriae]MBC2174798.1 hypothetical protein [Listeria booriae]
MTICLLVEVQMDPNQVVLYDTKQQANFTVPLAETDFNLVSLMIASSQNSDDEAIYLQVDSSKKTLIWNN